MSGKSFHQSLLRTLPLLLLAMLVSSCAIINTPAHKEKVALSHLRSDATAKYATFRAEKKWRNKTYRNEEILSLANTENTKVIISIKDQRGILLVDQMVAMDFPIASGKPNHPTPLGDFKIREKQQKYGSNIYGKIYDVTGVVVNAQADSKKDVIPEGGRFEGASMPYWMRLTDDGVGLHTGYVPGHPASHGCVRMPTKITPVVFARVKIGTPVEIVQLFDPASLNKKK
ncbi:MAG: L,D-transpeptidase [Chthoniobacterales bacterium]